MRARTSSSRRSPARSTPRSSRSRPGPGRRRRWSTAWAPSSGGTASRCFRRGKRFRRRPSARAPRSSPGALGPPGRCAPPTGPSSSSRRPTPRCSRSPRRCWRPSPSSSRRGWSWRRTSSRSGSSGSGTREPTSSSTEASSPSGAASSMCFPGPRAGRRAPNTSAIRSSRFESSCRRPSGRPRRSGRWRRSPSASCWRPRSFEGERSERRLGTSIVSATSSPGSPTGSSSRAWRRWHPCSWSPPASPFPPSCSRPARGWC